MKEDTKGFGRKKLLTDYCNFVKKTGKAPSRADLLTMGYNRDKVRNYFGNLINLKVAARKEHPKSFANIIDEGLFSQETSKKLNAKVAKYRRFVITTAVTGCKVFKPFLKSLEGYCKEHEAYLLILPSTDPASVAGFTLDQTLGQNRIVVSDLQLNANLMLSTIKTSAKQIDPMTGLDRLGQRHCSVIYASPKQRFRLVPMGNSVYPHALMTTGAITKPNYTPNYQRTHAYMSERTAYIAGKDHVMGALIVELDKGERFHVRQVQSDRNGGFIDIGSYYLKDSVTSVSAEALVLGDWHSGETDPSAKRAWKEVSERISPRYIFIHDGFNGRSINPHERHQIINQAKNASKGNLDLKAELRQFARDLDELSTWSKDGIVVVKSNHDVFLERYLQEGGYLNDPHNHKIAVKLADAMLEGKDPLQFGVELMGLKNKTRVKWLGIDDDFRVAGVQLAAHGHQGANGKRNPSLMELEKCYGQSMSGHSHSSEILRGAWRVGTSSYLKLDYNKGPSSWVHCSGEVYKNGSRQLIHAFDGSWTTMKKGSKSRA